MPEFLDPNQVLNQISLQSDFIAADFGCGSGGWTIPLAQRLEEGKVYAIDIKEEALSALKSRISLAKVNNIKPILADAEKEIPELRDSSCDLVLMTNILFQVENRKTIFEQAKRILKKGGKVLVVEWNFDSPFGPSQDHKVLPEEIKKLAIETGLELEKEFPAGSYNFGLLFNKK